MFAGKYEFKTAYQQSIADLFGKPLEVCTGVEKYQALVKVVTDETSAIRKETVTRQREEKEKKIYYFSMEFLIGPLLENYLINLGMRDIAGQALADLGIDIGEIFEQEQDPGLGNGGLGRLAACYLASAASENIACTGEGLRYHLGLFNQKIENGYQIEKPDAWLENGFPWEQERSEDKVQVRFGGRIERHMAEGGKITFEHLDYSCVNAVPYDVPIVGFGGSTVNHLRLWQAQAAGDHVDMEAFNNGDYAKAMAEQSEVEAITCVLYPDDSTKAGKELRLKQEYFLVAAGVGSIVRKFKSLYGAEALRDLPDYVAIHINDTHAALCVAELMRILLDEEGFEWDEAWDVVVRTTSYTNHTVLPEALERWPQDYLQSLLPRVYMIVDEINRRWRESLVGHTDNVNDLMYHTAVLWDGTANMANLCIIGSHSVNGVAGIHSDILKNNVFPEFNRLDPAKFNNKTNGVSHRRFLLQSNPGLAALINETIGPGWIQKPEKLIELEPFEEDAAFRERLMQIKRDNKERLASYIKEHNGTDVDPDSVFDIQVKRIHAYKRQLLNALKILNLYNMIKEGNCPDISPYTFIFAGKAAPGYALAKEIIKFVNSIADVVNKDPDASRLIKVVFIENFRISNAQIIYPAADFSEQISTAGKEASGTGCMKFIMNGAVTLGTLDGANVEIREHVGEENAMIFGLRADEILNYKLNGGYSAQQEIEKDPRLKKMTEQLVNGFFDASGCQFWGISDDLTRHNDEYFVLKDFAAYFDAWLRLDAIYKDGGRWGAMSCANIANSGFFSSDRAVKEYADDIWHIPVK